MGLAGCCGAKGCGWGGGRFGGRGPGVPGGFGLGGHGPPSLWRAPHRMIVVSWKFCMLLGLCVCVFAEAACRRASARELSVYICRSCVVVSVTHGV